MSVTTRGIQRGDVSDIARLHAVCFPDEPWEPSALATVLAMPGASGHVASTEGGDLAGFLIEQCLSEVAEILTLGVAPAMRRQGVAGALLRAATARFVAIGAERIVLEVAADNQAGIALYQSLGFARQGTRPGYYHRAQGPRIDAWRLSVDIRALSRP